MIPEVGFALGYANESGTLRDPFPLSCLVHRETYADYDANHTSAVYREREEAGWKRTMENPGLKERVERGGSQNLAQVFTKAKYTRESHVEYSRRVLASLEE